MTPLARIAHNAACNAAWGAIVPGAEQRCRRCHWLVERRSAYECEGAAETCPIVTDALLEAALAGVEILDGKEPEL